MDLREAHTAQLGMMYVGYRDGSFVPFRLLKYSIYTSTIEDEEYVRKALCLTQKIGNGAGGCTRIEHHGLTARWRREDKLRQNHYIYEVIATVPKKDMPIYDKLTTKKLGRQAENNMQHTRDTRGGQACTLGFCD